MDLSKAAKSDDLDDTVNYAAVYETVVTIVEERSYVLLESVASAILDEILSDHRVSRAALSIAKPDLLDGATPSVTLVRENNSR